MSEILNGYRVVTAWTTAGGGMGKWAFAERGGKQYFIKQFLSPTYPLPDGPGSAETKARKAAACERFERHHRALVDDLRGVAGDGGHLIVTKDFFRVGAKYYKVTDRIETSALAVEDISRLTPARNRVILSLSLAHSLAILHRQRIVHGDLKPANILPKLASKDVFVAKLIDFDDSYRAKNPPPRDEIVGDFTYYSPETLQYIREERDANDLDIASDIFALGVVLCQYFAGALPVISRPTDGSEPAKTVALATLQGHPYRTGLEESWPDVDELLRSMLHPEPHRRPTIGEVSAALSVIRDRETKGERRLGTSGSRPESTPEASPAPRLKGKGLSIGSRPPAGDGAAASPPEPPSTSGLRGSLARPKGR